MCVCMCVCVCVCMYVWMCFCVSCVCEYVWTCVRECIYNLTQSCQRFTLAGVFKRLPLCCLITQFCYKCWYLIIHTHACMHTHTRAHTQTSTQMHLLFHKLELQQQLGRGLDIFLAACMSVQMFDHGHGFVLCSCKLWLCAVWLQIITVCCVAANNDCVLWSCK